MFYRWSHFFMRVYVCVCVCVWPFFLYNWHHLSPFLMYIVQLLVQWCNITLRPSMMSLLLYSFIHSLPFFTILYKRADESRKVVSATRSFHLCTSVSLFRISICSAQCPFFGFFFGHVFSCANQLPQFTRTKFDKFRGETTRDTCVCVCVCVCVYMPFYTCLTCTFFSFFSSSSFFWKNEHHLCQTIEWTRLLVDSNIQTLQHIIHVTWIQQKLIPIKGNAQIHTYTHTHALAYITDSTNRSTNIWTL